MDELRNILVNIRHLQIELNKDEQNQENINFYLNNIIERIEIELKREQEEIKHKQGQIEEYRFLIDEYIKK